MTPNTMLGVHAATSGGISPLLPNPFVSCTRKMNMIVVPRARPTPYAAPPRCVLVASEAANRSMITLVIGMTIDSRSVRGI